jgi:MYXO-CTERM domain-containing protein
VTPASGPSTVRSFQITSANDAVERDPTSYELYGTNAAIASTDNSYGTAESWTLIGSGALALPATRDTLGAVVPVSNESSYTSYKMLFPTLTGPAVNIMQIAEASFYSTADGSGADILNPGDAVLGIDATTITGLQSKYLNFGENNSGVIVTPAAGPKVVTSLQITTAGDAVERDPAAYEIYGTNAAITSAENSRGTGEAWTLISSGALTLPAERLTEAAAIAFANTTAYSSYKILFPTVKDATVANSMQISGIQLFDSSVASDPDFDGDGDVDGRDFLTWQRGLGLTGQTNNDNGDADGNGIVNAADLTAWRTAFNASANVAAGSVPEPHSAALVLVALGAIAAGRRSNRRS